MRGIVAPLLVSVWGACLPQQALSRREELPAQLYEIEASSSVTSQGVDLAPFVFELRARVGWSYARTFRDGSLGHLVEIYEAQATMVRGSERAPVDTRLPGAILELRSFPDGQLLTVTGASNAIGDGGHLELLGGLWPALSPHIPGRADASPFTSSWPTWIADGPHVRNTILATWSARAGGSKTPDEAGLCVACGARAKASVKEELSPRTYGAAGRSSWSYEGDVRRTGGPVEASGRVVGELVLGSGAQRVVSHALEFVETIDTRWPAGPVRQGIDTTIAVRHVGEGPRSALDMPVRGADPASDARALALVDGRAARDLPSDPRVTTPFLFLPDDLPAETRAALRAALFTAGSIGP